MAAKNDTKSWLREGAEVHGGEPHTEDYDEGTVLEVDWEREEAHVAWSYDRGWVHVDLLREGHPGLWASTEEV